ncbi:MULTISPECIES: J domain-containing protein [Bradyrhizobium]|uniref:J domain-containing protein n=1 Tax=Bradyrhizobium aeschynomenes TaxID=2734909 RepID=A0ABX2CQ76_9BRAD|nr:MULTISPECIES: J domain-containing protein [Bradyrhizobium]NPU69850.1 J domain-containing protein [Bradyrhizobium aeschynomenes]NPV24549.1 J domain-containing protein [Bradyrhizobium aeschynomenes]
MTSAGGWVIWNGSMGIVDEVRLGRIVDGATGRLASLAPPYDVVGPFSLDELETQGRITFGACLVMSQQRWRQDQDALRIAARAARRALLDQFARGEDDEAFRAVLELPLQGRLTASDIKTAFRRLAKSAHPDAGGSSELYRRISEAREALLAELG